MLSKIKRRLYFTVARYFTFWATIQLRRWKPMVIVVTGSSGKTTTMHLIEAQFGEKAQYSHHANSIYGISFDILDLHRITLAKVEWLSLFASAPFKAFKKPSTAKIYVAEVDCDRPREGELLAKMLRPHTTVWQNVSLTHTMNFDAQVAAGTFKNLQQAIAHAFGALVQYAQTSVIVNGDDQAILDQLPRTKAQSSLVSLKECTDYSVSAKGTTYKAASGVISLPNLEPKVVFYSVRAVQLLCEQFNIPFDEKFTNLEIPPGRSSVFAGVKDTVLVDSSYNSAPDSLRAILGMVSSMPGKPKWLVLGDMLEQGSNEQAAHEGVVEAIAAVKADRIILMGPRIIKYTFPLLQKQGYGSDKLVAFDGPKEVLDYLQVNLRGGETILFKGARFLEGVVENLLADKANVAKLCRREAIWDKRRKSWGL
jgi:UDP-N-acetylmuramoyl-tripeptide--D-alanyl-D-alanine ligase